MGLPPPHSNYLVSFLGLEEPSLKLLRSSELQRTNSSPISNCQHSKSAIFISRNINSNINSLLRLRVGTHIIYIYIYGRRQNKLCVPFRLNAASYFLPTEKNENGTEQNKTELAKRRRERNVLI